MRSNTTWLAFGISSLLAVSLFMAGTGAISGATNVSSPVDKEAIQRLIKAGIISGDSSGNLHTEDPITRAQFAKILAMALDLDILTSVKSSSFKDVSPTAWYAGYIDAANKLATQNGFELGQGNGKFDPDKKLTTAEALAFLQKFLGIKVDKGTTAGSNWISDAIAAAIKSKLITSDQAGNISGKNNATRGFVFQLSDNAFMHYELPTGETIYKKLHGDSVADEVYSEDSTGLAP